jgi:pimeloyl-ACP methyl ester carboxylesterase
MRIKNAALTGAIAGGAAAAGAAAFNRAVTQPAGSLPNLIGGEEGTYEWRAEGGPHRVAYTRRGAGPAVLLVHSIHAAAWSYEWRHNVDALAREHTVYTVDLLGFGRSDRPPLDYSARLYVSLLLDFAADVVGEPCAIVGSSLGAAFVVAAAARAPERFPAVALVGPVGITHLSWPPGPANDATHALVRSPLAGSALFNALVTKPSLRFFLGQTYAQDDYVTPELIDAYWRTAHQPGARYAVAAFVGMHLNLNVGDAARRLAQPVLITWGDQAKEVPRAELEAYERHVPHARVEHFDPCGSLPHDERSAEWNAVVLDFLAGAFAAGRGDVGAADEDAAALARSA